jgi:hypothetical protein
MEYPNSGSMFPNKFKKTSIDPNLKGTVKIERSLLKELMSESNEELIEIQIAGWTKEWKDGKFLSLRVSKPYKRDAAPKQQDDDIDSIPF